MVRFWSIKQHIQYWCSINDIDYIYVNDAAVGAKGLEISILGRKMTNKEFIELHPKLETEYMTGYLTLNKYPYLLYVSFKRKKSL